MQSTLIGRRSALHLIAGGAGASGFAGPSWAQGPDEVRRLVGIFGQHLHIGPAAKLVISIQSAWPKPSVRGAFGRRWLRERQNLSLFRRPPKAPTGQTNA